ncbi:tetratricopeptide repeat, ankyrin repeat and coiled-coil containing 1 [Phyllostomus discolor]|uniref:Tetratricopeptide repeat, ankyrin repeat and coiled-coil containing 1 n=1 Tax=Phyllostomus discolor TaxID=89673 RepID=A0A834ATA0_9CHIR|nr:tetratricopeptide repeat, ankyrin repeat and coiled-coil containing 1 [Phyllostomus discolor]
MAAACGRSPPTAPAHPPKLQIPPRILRSPHCFHQVLLQVVPMWLKCPLGRGLILLKTKDQGRMQ